MAKKAKKILVFFFFSWLYEAVIESQIVLVNYLVNLLALFILDHV